MKETITKNFRSSFHGLIDVPDIKKKTYLKKIVESELSRRDDIPKPFYLSMTLPRKPVSPIPVGKVSVCVVEQSEIDSLIEENPNIKGIYTDEVALSSFLSQKEKGPFYGIICYEKEISILLAQDGCILYSTRIPRGREKLGKVEIENINSIIKYTMGLPREAPSKVYIVCKDEGPFDKLILPTERIESFHLIEDAVKDYNLVPREFLEERFRTKLSNIVSISLLILSMVFFLYSLFLYKRINSARSYLESKKQEERILIETFKSYKNLKKIFQQNMGNVERYISIKSSFIPLVKVADAINIVSSKNMDITKVVALRDIITINGTIPGESYSESYLVFLGALQDIKKEFNVISESFNPESKEFQLALRWKQNKS